MAKEKSPTPKTVEDLRPDSKNPNRGSERGTGLLEDALRRLGAARSIVIDKNNRIISGNHAAQAALDAGILRLKVVETNGQELVAVKRTDVDLHSKMGRELSISDNRIAQLNLDWDPEQLAATAEQYDIDLNALGISPGELQGLLEDAQNPDDPREPKGKKPVVCPHCGESFTPKSTK